MKLFFTPRLFGVILLILAFRATAQEVQISMDNEGTVPIITAELEQRLELFTAYSNFQEARLYQLSDTAYVLEVVYGPQERIVKDRLPHTRQQVVDLRNQISERLAQVCPAPAINQEGRTKLLVGSSLLSLGYYGWAVPEVFDVQGSQAYAAVYMLVSAGGFFVPFLLTRDNTITRGEASLYLYGASRGIGHGMLLDLLIQGDNVSTQGMLASGLITSLGEGLAGYAIANQANMSDGTACIIGVGGDFGLAIGGGAAYLADFKGDNQEQPIAGSCLAGSVAGMWAGKILANNQRYSRGDAYVVRAAGMLGMYVPVALLACIKPASGDMYMGTAMAGLIGGTGIGHYLIRDKDFSSSQGTVITIGEFAGGLLGLGLAYLVTPQSSDNPRSYLLLSTAGGIGGFWATYALFKHDLKTSRSNVSWNLDIVPKSSVTMSTHRLFKMPPATVIPAVQVEVHF